MSRTTQGPWSAENCGGAGVRYAIRHHLSDRGRPAAIRIATVFETGSANDPNEMSHANARLIASAPDLLEALKYARRFLEAEDHDVQFVDAAIAKAEGND